MNMRKGKHLVVSIALLLVMQAGLTQTFKAGERVEAFINNQWQEVQIVKPVAGKTNTFQVIAVTVKDRNANAKVVEVSKQNMRAVKQTAVLANLTPVATEEPKDLLRRYELYAGIPTIYLGHFILQSNGKYKVAFSTDEADYENGTYAYHPESNSIEWLSGLFKNKSWSGKLVKKSGGYRIEFSSTTFGE